MFCSPEFLFVFLVLEWTQNKVKTLEQTLHEEQCHSGDLQTELRQCQRDLDQYKTDRQKLLVAIAEKVNHFVIDKSVLIV